MGQRRQGREARASGEPGGVPAWHSQEPAEVLAELAASAQGLTDDQAAERLERHGVEASGKDKRHILCG